MKTIAHGFGSIGCDRPNNPLPRAGLNQADVAGKRISWQMKIVAAVVGISTDIESGVLLMD